MYGFLVSKDCRMENDTFYTRRQQSGGRICCLSFTVGEKWTALAMFSATRRKHGQRRVVIGS